MLVGVSQPQILQNNPVVMVEGDTVSPDIRHGAHEAESETSHVTCHADVISHGKSDTDKMLLFGE